MKPDFKEAAENAFRKECEGNMNFWLPREPDDEEVKYWKEIYTNGANHGYSLAMEQHRDFYLLVREYFKHDHFRMHDEHEALYNKIQKHIAAFSEREQTNLPFSE
jgi:hypothetical protein